MKSSYYTIAILLVGFMTCFALSAQTTQPQQLKPVKPVNGEGIGLATATDGHFIVASTRSTRQLQVFEKQEDGWWHVTNLRGNNDQVNGQASKGFGASISIQGDRIVAGVPDSYLDATKNVGLVEVFVKDEESWTLEAAIRAPVPVAKAGFGKAVAIHGERMVIGAPSYEYNTGQAYIYSHTKDGWEGIQLTNPNENPTFEFGAAVAMNPDMAIVTTPGLQIKRKTVGGFYVYMPQEDGTWNVAQTIAGNSRLQNLGQSISMQNDIMAVGAYDAVALYQYVDGEWTQTAIIPNPDAGEAMSFASSVSLSPNGKNIMVGASGKGYLFGNFDGEWQLMTTVVDEAPMYCSSVTIGDDFFLVNSPYAGETYMNGAIYLYQIAPFYQALIR
jgi:hypothetical protein